MGNYKMPTKTVIMVVCIRKKTSTEIKMNVKTKQSNCSIIHLMIA